MMRGWLILVTTADDATIDAFNAMVRETTDGQELTLMGGMACVPRVWGANVSHPRFHELEEHFHELKWPEATLLMSEVDYLHGVYVQRPGGKTLAWGECDAWGSSVPPTWPCRGGPPIQDPDIPR